MKVATDREKVNFIKYGLAIGLTMDKLISLLDQARNIQTIKNNEEVYKKNKQPTLVEEEENE